MAYETSGGEVLAVKAGADLSAAQYKAVKFDVNGNIVLAGAGEDALGILQDDPANGQVGTVKVYGVSKAIAGAAVARGAQVTPDAQGRVVAAAMGNTVIGKTLAAATGANEVIPVLVINGGTVHA